MEIPIELVGDDDLGLSLISGSMRAQVTHRAFLMCSACHACISCGTYCRKCNKLGTARPLLSCATCHADIITGDICMTCKYGPMPETENNRYAEKVDDWNHNEESEESDDGAISTTPATPSETYLERKARILASLSAIKRAEYERCRDREGVFLITFDGYHRKNIKVTSGGYGAMLWSGGKNSHPIAAVSGNSGRKHSTFFHILEGLLCGLEIALGFPDIDLVYLACNSDRVCSTVRECFVSSGVGCPRHPHLQREFDRVGVCGPCLRATLHKEDPLEPIIEIMGSILDKGQKFMRGGPWISAHPKDLNKPADFLAKMSVKLGTVGRKFMNPQDFPDDLKSLVGEYGGRSAFPII